MIISFLFVAPRCTYKNLSSCPYSLSSSLVVDKIIRGTDITMFALDDIHDDNRHPREVSELECYIKSANHLDTLVV